MDIPNRSWQASALDSSQSLASPPEEKSSPPQRVDEPTFARRTTWIPPQPSRGAKFALPSIGAAPMAAAKFQEERSMSNPMPSSTKPRRSHSPLRADSAASSENGTSPKPALPKQHGTRLVRADFRAILEGYKREMYPTVYFQRGIVFQVMVAVAEGELSVASDPLHYRRSDGESEDILPRIRRYIVIRPADQHSNCLPIYNYGTRGVGELNNRKSEHGIVYTGQEPPQAQDEELPEKGEQGMRDEPVRVIPEDPMDKLHTRSRIDYGTIHKVPHTSPVKKFGKVHSASMNSLIHQFNNVWIAAKSRASSQASQGRRAPTSEKSSGGSSTRGQYYTEKPSNAEKVLHTTPSRGKVTESTDSQSLTSVVQHCPNASDLAVAHFHDIHLYGSPDRGSAVLGPRSFSGASQKPIPKPQDQSLAPTFPSREPALAPVLRPSQSFPSTMISTQKPRQPVTGFRPTSVGSEGSSSATCAGLDEASRTTEEYRVREPTLDQAQLSRPDDRLQTAYQALIGLGWTPEKARELLMQDTPVAKSM